MSFRKPSGSTDIANLVRRERRAAPQQSAAPDAPEQASLDQIARHRRVLLLQGPNGPFFTRLREVLLAKGCQITKVNFNGGDDFWLF
ncbi:hypothetical protein D9M71_791590 [compost metagenome]